ncbi:MAG: RadC family protein [Candidatus Sumerlaeaceae bacterium]
MEELNLIDWIERLRGRLLSDVPALAETLEHIRSRDYRTLSLDHLKERLIAVTLGIDDSMPEGRREIRRQLNALDSNELERGHNEHGKTVQQLSESLQLLTKTSQNGNSTTPFAERLANCPNLITAVALVAKEFPFLRGRKPYEFLLAIGYPAAIPAADTMRFLFRLGQVTTRDLNAQTTRNYFERMQHLSRVSNVPLPELDYLFGSYSGARKKKGFPVPCGNTPRCAECTLTSFCSYVKHNPPQPIQPRNVPIKAWAHDERPRERMLSGERLSSAELIAIILRTGSGSRSALDLGRELIHKFGTLHGLETASIADITTVRGIGKAKAVEIKAAIELGKRITQPAADARDGLKSLGSSRDVFDMYRPRFKSATQEEFVLLALNTKNKIQREFSISVGTLNASIVHPRDVFKPALAEAAAGVVFVHNHPSGDPSPSPEDHALTRRLVEAGNILGIKVLDHVIVGAQRYYSFADEGMLG